MSSTVESGLWVSTLHLSFNFPLSFNLFSNKKLEKKAELKILL